MSLHITRRPATCIECREAIDVGQGLWLERERANGSGTYRMPKHVNCLSGGDLERMDPRDLDSLDDLRAVSIEEDQNPDGPDERIGGACIYRFLHEDAEGWRGHLWRLADAAGTLADTAERAESFGVVSQGSRGTAGVIVLAGEQTWDSDLPGTAVAGILVAVRGIDPAARERAIRAGLRAATEDLIGEVEGELARQAKAPKEDG